MPFPNFEGKHAHDAFFSPRELIAYNRKLDRLPDFATPRGVVVCYQPSLLRYVAASEDVQSLKVSAGDLHLLGRTENRVGGFGIGAPVAAIVVEELVALGTAEFITVGTAGGLQRGMRTGDVVVCTEAIRDEGVPYHYLAPARCARPSAALTERLRGALTKAAAIFAVAAYRRVAAAAAFAISDSLADLVWDPQFASPDLGPSLERLYRVAVETLAGR